MSKMQTGDGRVLAIVAPAGGVTSGVPIRIGNLFGIPIADAAAGASCAIEVEGVHAIPKQGGAGVVFAQGALVCWDQATGYAVAHTAAGYVIGVAHVAAPDAATSVEVKIDGRAYVDDSIDETARAAAEAAQAAIPSRTTITVTAGQTLATVPLPSGWADGDLVLGIIAGGSTAGVSNIGCAGGSVAVGLSEAAGEGGTLVHVIRLQGLPSV